MVKPQQNTARIHQTISSPNPRSRRTSNASRSPSIRLSSLHELKDAFPSQDLLTEGECKACDMATD
jgi:hypothetical protein